MAENIKENHFKEHPGQKYFTRQIEYWKKRCELAEKVLLGKTSIFKSEDQETMDVFMEWSVFANDIRLDIEDAKRPIEVIFPSRLHEQDEVGEIDLKHIKLSERFNLDSINKEPKIKGFH